MSQQLNGKKEYSNLDDNGNLPEFEILKKNEQPEKIKATSKINLAISLSKYRLNHLFDSNAIQLIGDIYHKIIFEIFIHIACEGFGDKPEEDENIIKYSPYLYLYSDIWGFDDLKEIIKKIWSKNPKILEINVKNEQNNKFLEDVISYQRQIFTDSFQEKDLPSAYLTPIEFFTKNINTLLKENFETNKFIHLPPEILNLIFQNVSKNELDGKIYFNFLMQYIQEAYEQRKDLFLCSTLVSYLNLDALDYDDLKKYVNMDFVKKMDENKEDNYNDYFDFLSFSQFKSFAKLLIKENDETKKELESVKSELKELQRLYDNKEANINELLKNKLEETIKSVNEKLEPIQKNLDEHNKRIANIETYNKNIDTIKEEITEFNSKSNDILNDFYSIKGDVDNLSYQYQVSSYIISAINQQFIYSGQNKQYIFNINDTKNEIICQAEIERDQFHPKNDIVQDKFQFTLTEGTNPIIYFRYNSFLSDYKSSDKNYFCDLIIKEYEIEVENDEFQRPLSWRLEGFFPRSYKNYCEFAGRIKDVPDAQDDQWFPISIHSIADASVQDDLSNIYQKFDALNTDEKYNIYRCSMGFSPICKCIRLRIIRNSNDTDLLRIHRFKLVGRVLQPFVE